MNADERLTDLQIQIDGLTRLVNELWDRQEKLLEKFLRHNGVELNEP